MIFGDKEAKCAPKNVAKTSKVLSLAKYGRRLEACDPENWGVGDLSKMKDDARGQ